MTTTDLDPRGARLGHVEVTLGVEEPPDLTTGLRRTWSVADLLADARFASPLRQDTRKEGALLTRRLDEALRNERGGQVSYLLLGKGDFGSEHLAITWVTGEAGSEQQRHEHPESEQVYVIIAGRGVMFVGDESQEVDAGTLVLVPPGTLHSIRNIGQETLAYVSATSPPFDPPPTASPFAYR